MKDPLLCLESETKAALLELKARENIIHDPIIDGVIDIDSYRASAPKILWILKEPWEKLPDGVAGGNWSIPEYLRIEGNLSNKGTWATMAYVSYSVFNNFPKWQEIPYISKEPAVAKSLRKIAYINISKFPGKTGSKASQIAAYFQKNQAILLKQISVINPDIVIGGATLTLFLEDFGLVREEFQPTGSLKFCVKNRRLYIDAFHPAQWKTKKADYVDEIVSVIKQQSPVLPPPNN